MKLRQWLDHWDMDSLRIQESFLEMEWNPGERDKDAAWELYVELLTRFPTQPFDRLYGDEEAALDSIHSLFPVIRQVIRNNGRDCVAFTRITVVILNQIVRPFIARWHGVSLNGGFEQPSLCGDFRAELVPLQQDLRKFTRMLADMAGVEDLTALEATQSGQA